MERTRLLMYWGEEDLAAESTVPTAAGALGVSKFRQACRAVPLITVAKFGHSR